MCSHHSNMFNEKQCDFNPVPVFWTHVRKFLLQSYKRNKDYFVKSASLKGGTSLNNIDVKTMKNQMPKQQVMNEMHMTKLEGNGQPLQRVGNQLMIKFVQRGNQRINIQHKWRKMKKCLTQIQSNKLVNMKLSFYVSIQGGLPFVVKFLLLHKFFEIWTYLEIWKAYLDFHLINW